jgi:hypothetical protein
MTPEIQAYNWVWAAIDSCETDFHFKGADILIELFKRMFPDGEEDILRLEQLRVDKWNEKHYIIS